MVRGCGCVQHLQRYTYKVGKYKVDVGTGTMSTSEAYMVLLQLLPRNNCSSYTLIAGSGHLTVP
jgi:hypothetical protein